MGIILKKDTYLGDIISSDGKHYLTIKDRYGKGIGIVSEILNTLETVSFGVHFFKIFNLLREALFINGTLTNAECWYGLEIKDMKMLEDLDRQMIRKVFQCPFSTPAEAGHLELGLLPLNCIIKQRRVNYLHYILKTDKSKLLYKFFMAMWEDEIPQDWTEQIRIDLADLNIKHDLSYIESQSKLSFKIL